MGLAQDLSNEMDRSRKLEEENRKLRRLLCNLYDGAARIEMQIEEHEDRTDGVVHPDLLAELHEAGRIASFMKRAIQKAFPNFDLITRSLEDNPNANGVWVPLDVDKEE